MLRHMIIAGLFLLVSHLTSAHLPYLDPDNSHGSYYTAFQFPDSLYSRALCTTTTCPPPNHQYNRTSYYTNYGGYQKPWSKESWSKVYVRAGECLHFEFGVPHIPALEYPVFRPTVYLLGSCLPPCAVFGYPAPYEIEYPPFDLPYGYTYNTLKALRFNLADPGYQPAKFYEPHLDSTFLSYLNYTVPIGCDGDVYIIVETHEKRIVEYYVAVGEKEGFPPYGSTEGIASVQETQAWANGDNPKVGEYCRKRGYWERE
ncbi:hypothetical protein H072_1170 [Dactylellina haptotyla CBS 200.50]|uniref:Uncharacterized protein n=1 Tax=Dactylellina haptotyla (strain CBS 200.50) TaxID=1284197 RepID=S8AV87_DACHA|nr:hypothetical protein H072_1170 [Dactylellina haptotyla CBS 200.50]